MSEAKLARQIDILGRRHALFDQTDRFDHQRMQYPVDGKTNDVLDPDCRLACLGAGFDGDLHGLFRRIHRRDHFDQLHA